MSTATFASVVIPARNASETIDTQLAALASQDATTSWEVIVADNGSSDDTAERARAWAGRVPRLRVVDASARRGPSAARNIGAAAAVGTVLLFCDSDDAAESGWVSALAAAVEKADAAAGGRRYTALNTKEHGPMDWPQPFFVKAPLIHLAAASSHNLAVRTEAFWAMGGFDEAMDVGEDIDLCWRLQLSGYTFAPAPQALMQIRRRTGFAATYRQALAYGRADALLEIRYAHLIPEAEAKNVEDDPLTLWGRLRRRGLRPPDPVHLLDRLGRRRGARQARRGLDTTHAATA